MMNSTKRVPGGVIDTRTLVDPGQIRAPRAAMLMWQVVSESGETYTRAPSEKLAREWGAAILGCETSNVAVKRTT